MSDVNYVIPLFISVLHTANLFSIVSPLLTLGEMMFCIKIHMVNSICKLNGGVYCFKKKYALCLESDFEM